MTRTAKMRKAWPSAAGARFRKSQSVFAQTRQQSFNTIELLGQNLAATGDNKIVGFLYKIGVPRAIAQGVSSVAGNDRIATKPIRPTANNKVCERASHDKSRSLSERFYGCTLAQMFRKSAITSASLEVHSTPDDITIKRVVGTNKPLK